MKIDISRIFNALSFLLFTTFCHSAFSDTLEVTFLFVGDEDSQAYMGAKQGLIEANLQGEFLGQNYVLKTVDTAHIDTSINDSVVSILVAQDKDTLLSIATDFPDIAVMNLSIEDNELRQTCSTNLFHTIPSLQMKSDAIAQWQQKQADSSASAQAWHPDFKKFAARDLNKRFLKSNKAKMLDRGWAGWSAVKMISDTVARENKTDAKAILAYLKNDLAFDGQKGISLNFRDNGQLRQPMLIVENDKILAEAPIRGIANPPTLDSLGITDCQ